jgi:hypothetical protein
MKSRIVPSLFRFTGSKRGVGVVLIMLWTLSAGILHAKTKPFAPADQVGPYEIGYNRVELVDPSRDATFGGRTLVTHLWYPVDVVNAAGATPVIYDAGLVSLALFGIPASHGIFRSPFGALVDASSTLPPSGDIPGACPPAPPLVDLATRAVGEKYRVELRRGVPNGFTDICAFLAGNLEVIQQGNASPLDPFNLFAFLTFDGQDPQLPPEFFGKANSGPQSICSPDLFYRPDNFAVWNAVTLLPPAPPLPLSTFLFPPDRIPGYHDADSKEYTPSLASSQHLRIVNTEVVAFFNKHLQEDMHYHHYLLPSYAHAKKLDAEVEYCKATPGNAEVCFDKNNTE